MQTFKTVLLCLLLGAGCGGVQAATPRTDIHADASQVQPLLPGMQAPAFNLRDARDEPVSFDPENMAKPLVLTFFRGGWCPYCNLHLAEMRKAEEELESLGFDIWFVSIDKPEVLYASLEQPDIGYRVLSDSKLEATRAFGLAFRVPAELVEQYHGWGIDLEGASGETHHVLPVPSTYLIGSDGVIRFQYSNPDYTVRLHPDVLLAAARAYRNDEDSRLQRAYEAKAGTQESEDTAQAHHGHAAHEAAPAPAPTLAEGQRWATDAPLREAMLRIREGVASRMHAFHEESLSVAEAQALAAAVEADVQYMIANCRLEPQPDAALHALIGRMLGAAEALRTDPASPGGMPQLVSVVRDYGATFDHPGWEPL